MDKNALAFYEEAVELLAKLEIFLLDLEKTPDSKELINEVFRALHTLKGSGSMFGFNELAQFVHNIETTFALVRQEELELSKDLINLTLQARDLMKLLIEKDRQLTEEEAEKISDFTEAFALLSELKKEPIKTSDKSRTKNDAPPENTEATPAEKAAISAEPIENIEKVEDISSDKSSSIKQEIRNYEDMKLNIFDIFFRPFPDFFSTGNNPLIILEELASLGEAIIKVNTDAIPEPKEINPEQSYLSWQIKLTTNVDENAVRDVFLFVEDICDLNIRIFSADETTDISISEPEREEEPRKPEITLQAAEPDSAEPLIQKPVQTPATAKIDMTPQKPVEKPASSFDSLQTSTGIKVDANRLDRLIGLLGELVTIQARMSQTADKRGDAELITLAQELDALTGDLRDSAMKLSMLPINSIFPKIEKMVKNSAIKEDKDVSIRLIGGDTELDKGILSKLFAPLARIISFCIGESIETAAERNARNKPDKAVIELAASHSSGNVCINISDDGKGFESHDPLPEVRKVVEEMRGSLDSHSEFGKGMNFSIRIPLNLAIIEGLMVRLEDGLFVFPLSIVEECIELTEEDQTHNYNKNVIMLRGQIIPYIKLRDSFAIEGSPPSIQQIVITNINHQRVGFTVDKVVGEYQTVIKNWGKFCSDTPGISGATILGDGTVALIADLPQIIKEERHVLKAAAEVNN